MDRRSFVRLSTGSLLAASSLPLRAEKSPAQISNENESVHVTGVNYFWEYTRKDDRFRLLDSKNRLVVTGPLQPAVLVAPAENAMARQWISGKAARHSNAAGSVTFQYEGVNGAGRLSVTWRFDKYGIWIEPVVY